MLHEEGPAAGPAVAQVREGEPIPQEASDPEDDVAGDDEAAERFALDVDDLWRLSDEELGDALIAYWRFRYGGGDFRTLDRKTAEAFEQRLRDAIPEDERTHDPVLRDFHSTLRDSLRRQKRTLRDTCREGSFFKALFWNGRYDGANRHEVLSPWRRNLEALGMKLDTEEGERVGDVILDAYSDFHKLQQRYVERSGASDAWDRKRSARLRRLANNLLERDLVEYYYDWESSLRDALTEENFAVAEKLFRSLGLQGGQPVAGEFDSGGE